MVGEILSVCQSLNKESLKPVLKTSQLTTKLECSKFRSSSLTFFFVLFETKLITLFILSQKMSEEK